MKKEDLKHFIDNLDVEEFKQYFYYHDRKETREHFGLSAGNLNDVLHHFNIKMPKELRNERRVQTYNDKYGCDNVFQSDYFKEKNAQTRLDRYGDPNYSNHEQAIKTIHDTIGMDELNRRRSAGHQRRSTESKFYFRMIDVWSIRDPSKIKSIIKNKLNALIIYPRQVKNTPDLIIEYKNGVLQK